MDSVSRLPEKPSRQDVLAFISRSASYGNLGAFIGAGFPKAVLNEPVGTVALSWGDLLLRSAARMGVDYQAIEKSGLSYPSVASSICKQYSVKTGESYPAALVRLKQEVAALTSFYPPAASREQFADYLRTLAPAWIITTNYDLVIENLLTGRAMSLGPNDPISCPKGIIPVFHLHGTRGNPHEIILAQEDYVSLFRPTEYRQMKLALTLKESTTLLLGYGLGDVNVLTALDWSRNVFQQQQVSYPNEVIQVLREPRPALEPYRDANGIVILEAAEIAGFFDEFSAVRALHVAKEDRERHDLSRFAEELSNPNSATLGGFIDNREVRAEVLRMLSKFSVHLISSFVSFLGKCLDETWSRAEPRGAFNGYDQNLDMILDILTAFPADRFPPALFETAAYALERVSGYVGTARGQSWAAAATWARRKGELPEPVLQDLVTFAERSEYASLRKLLESG